MKDKKKFNPFKIIIVIFLIGLGLMLYSRYVGPTGLIVKENNIINEDLPNSFYGYKIVHISDIHYNTTILDKDLKNIIKKVNKINPDIIVITGDLLDKDVNYESNDKDILVDFLNNIHANYKYIISGDNDKDSMFKDIVDSTEFKLLDNSYEVLYNGDYEPIIIGGLSTKSDKESIADKIADIETAIYNYKSNYNILLVHEPSIIDSIDKDKYNLLLAGHTHNGQFNVPIIKNLFISNSEKNYNKEYLKINNTDMYISSGLGTSKIKGRLFNRPSINVYRLLDK